MTMSAVLDAAGRRRSPATMPGYHAGRSPRKTGLSYPADQPTVEEIVAVMRHAGDDRDGARLRALIAVLWRGGLRIQEALALTESDLDARRGSLLVRHKAAVVVRSGWTRGVGSSCGPGSTFGANCQLERCPASSTARRAATLVCPAGVRVELRRVAAQARARRPFAPHPLRHAHAVELAREGVPLNVIQRQLGHANLGTGSDAVSAR
jgi:integrase